MKFWLGMVVVLSPFGRLSHACPPKGERTLCGLNADNWQIDTQGGPPSCLRCRRAGQEAKP